MDIQIISNTGTTICRIPCINTTRKQAACYVRCLNRLLGSYCEDPSQRGLGVVTQEFIHVTLRYIAGLVGDGTMELFGSSAQLVGGVMLMDNRVPPEVRKYIKGLDPEYDNLEMAIEAMAEFDIPEPPDPDCSVCPWLIELAAEIHGPTS